MITKMDASSSTGKKREAKSSKSKGKKTKIEDVPPIRRLNQDMIQQMQAPDPKSRRLKQHLLGRDQLEDRYKEVRDVWIKVRGHKLFLFHYLKRNKEMLLCNPWMTNLGKLIVPNVFVNIRLLEVLIRNYNFIKRYIQFPNGDTFIRFSTGTVNEVFNLDPNRDKLLSFGELKEEYLWMYTTYTGWKIAIHKRQLGKLTKEDGPPFSIDLFRHYLQYTYMSCRQVGGVEVPNLLSIRPLFYLLTYKCISPGLLTMRHIW